MESCTDSIGTCEDCATAAKRMHHGFQDGCRGCAARAVARSAIYDMAIKSGYGWHDMQLQRLCSNYDVTRDELDAAAEIDADVQDSTT